MFVDASEAAPTRGEAGVTIEAGPRVGEATIEAILCDGIVEVTARTSDGMPLALGRRSRVIPPRLRRFVLHRDMKVLHPTNLHGHGLLLVPVFVLAGVARPNPRRSRN